jgi:molybdopterin/thiamine biosynthesis adenylyltransferase
MNRNTLHHEYLYRGDDLMRRLRDLRVTVCGAGALGANITESLARQGFSRLRVIDRDRIEERNLSTQPYFRSDIGAFKAKILSNSLYRALGVTIEAKTEELAARNTDRLLKESDLVLDAFDNSTSRGLVKDYCANSGIACLHTGLAADYAEVVWNEVYRVPSDANDDVCDYPLARNLIALMVGVACEVIIGFIARGERQSYTITLADLSIRPLRISGPDVSIEDSLR